MIRTSKGTITRWAAALVAASAALGALALTVVEGESPAGATPSGAGPLDVVAPRRPPPPDLDELLATADYVSEDGSYVRLGEVEMSSAPGVQRATPD
ncbi:MAG: hypothetical protein GEV08_14605 [Acidimicrobiia bacterium]|nr:hypothetical protein [Acidimicrobiia bacterium]